MLREPEAPVAPPLDVLRKIAGTPQRLGGRGAVDDRGEIENRERRQRHIRKPAGRDPRPAG